MLDRSLMYSKRWNLCLSDSLVAVPPDSFSLFQRTRNLFLSFLLFRFFLEPLSRQLPLPRLFLSFRFLSSPSTLLQSFLQYPSPFLLSALSQLSPWSFLQSLCSLLVFCFSVFLSRSPKNLSVLSCFLSTAVHSFSEKKTSSPRPLLLVFQ